MIETLLGGLLGGVFRLAPEALKFFDAKNARKHELAMQDKALEFEQLRGAQKMAEIGAAADAAWNTGSVEALKEALRGQMTKSGVGWADALSTAVRPVLTFWFMGMYCSVKIALLISAFNGGMAWDAAILATWTEADMAMWAGVLNFWFLGRVFEKVK